MIAMLIFTPFVRGSAIHAADPSLYYQMGLF